MVSADNAASHPSITTDAPPQKLSKKLIRLGIGLAAVYLATLILLVSFERYLVYPGIIMPLDEAWETAEFVHEEIEFTSVDGTRLVGWYLPCDDAKRTILFCHGNAEDAAKTSKRLCDELRQSLNANVFAFDYRGFGKSEGLPHQQAVLEDTESAMNWLCDRQGCQPDDIVVIGHSLGGGPAVYVASKLGARVLVLQRTFDALSNVAQSHYWFMPVKYVMHNRFPAHQWIRTCHVPLFCSHGTEDQVVPYKFGRRLFEASPASEKQFLRLDGADHFKDYDESYFTTLNEFLTRFDQSELSSR